MARRVELVSARPIMNWAGLII